MKQSLLEESKIDLTTQGNEMTIQKIISFKRPQALHTIVANKKD